MCVTGIPIFSLLEILTPPAKLAEARVASRQPPTWPWCPAVREGCLEKNCISRRRPGSGAWTSRCPRRFHDRAFQKYQRSQLQNCTVVCSRLICLTSLFPIYRMRMYIKCLHHRLVEKTRYINVYKALTTEPGTK